MNTICSKVVKKQREKYPFQKLPKRNIVIFSKHCLISGFKVHSLV